MLELIDFKINKYEAILKDCTIKCNEHQSKGDLLLWGFKEGETAQIELIIKDLKEIKKVFTVYYDND